MKKLLCVLIFCLSFTCAFSWEIIVLKDEFGDSTGEKALIHKVGTTSMSLSDIKGYDRFILAVKTTSGKAVSETSGIVKAKIDKSKPFALNCKILHGWGFITDISREQLYLIANGKEIKFAILNERRSYDVITIDLIGLKKLIHEID